MAFILISCAGPELSFQATTSCLVGSEDRLKDLQIESEILKVGNAFVIWPRLQIRFLS